MNKVGQRKVPFVVRLKKIKNEEVLFPVRLRARLEWSLEQKCNQNEISCPILDPRSVKHEDILIPNIFFETGTILYHQFHQCNWELGLKYLEKFPNFSSRIFRSSLPIY